MSRFVFKSLLFLFPLALLFGATEYKTRRMPSRFAVKRQILEANLERAEVFVAGSSHAFYGVKPAQLGAPAVSIAYPGQDFYYDARILLKYLPRARRAKVVVVTVSYLSFEYAMEESEASGQTNFYRKFWDVPRKSRAPRLADYSAVALFGLARSRDFLLTGKPPGNDKIDETGGSADFQTTDYFAVENGLAAVKRHESGMNAKHIDENVRYLDELFAALKEKGVRAAIVTTPCFRTYYDNLNGERYARMQTEIQSLARKYDLQYDNYLKDERFAREDFFDSDHLNTRGAEKFSRILKNEVISKYISTEKENDVVE